MDLAPCRPTILPYPYRIPSRPATQHTGVTPIPIQPNKIVYYGKLSPQKGTFELLHYFRELWAEGFPHPLHIIGGTDIVYHPEQLTMGQWVEREYGQYLRRGLLVLHGKIEPAAIPNALADAHVIVFPSIVDNLPYACIEALGCGKLVLASLQGGQREIITDGVNGLLFDHEQPGSFARQLRHALSLSDDELQRLCEAAHHSLDRYSHHGIAKKKLALLDEFLSGWQPPRRYPFLHEEPQLPQPPAPKTSGDLLSVVIPFYRLGPYLADCINSVLASTWKPLEILVVNDGSNDPESIFALQPWRYHPQVRVLDQPNKGLAETRNTGARHASGRFLAFLDADDTVQPDYYRKAIHVLLRYDNVHFAGSWVRYFGEAQGVWPAFPPSAPYLLAHNTINSSALVYKRDSFLAAGLNDAKLAYGLEDYESVVALTRHGFNGIVLPECLHNYRVRHRSMFRRMSREKALWSYDYILRKHRPWYERFAADLIPLLNANGPSYLYENPTLGVFVTSSTEKPGSWPSRIKNLARRNRTLKRVLLTIKKKTEKLWQTS
jgi:glycogen synthase